MSHTVFTPYLVSSSSRYGGGATILSKVYHHLHIPVIIILWLLILLYNFGVSDESTHRSLHPNRLRGANNLDIFSKDLSETSSNVYDSNGSVINHLIIVAGHAALNVNQIETADRSDGSWYLLSYQKNVGYPDIIFSHIKEGISQATTDLNSLLIFSGGQTRKDVGPISEAQSYYFVAKNKNLFPQEMISKDKLRVFTEDYARDSFENLLFSICRFKEVTNRYPSKITVIGFDFKSHRFISQHRRAIGFPSANFTYIGLKPNNPDFNYENAIKGEEVAKQEFEKDKYGCHSKDLVSKKKKRNPFYRTIPYILSCSEMKDLLTWCGPELYDYSKLPW